MAKRKNKNLGPRRKRMSHEGRLLSAKTWIPTYQGKHLAKGYRNWFGVDYPTAFIELELLGVSIDPEYKEGILRSVGAESHHRKRKKMEKAKEKEQSLASLIESDENFAYIAGYTSGGAAYGITWKEWEREGLGADSDAFYCI